MAINISAWRLAIQILVSSLIVNTTVLKNEHVVAEMSVIPLWNVTVNETDAQSCDLATDNNLQGAVRLTGDTVKTCGVQLTSSNGTAALIRITKGTLVYAERQENILDCQRKYVSVTADEPCFFVFRHTKLLLFLQGDNANGSSVTISQMTGNASAHICQDGASNKGQHTSRVSQTNYCKAHEFNDLVSCNLLQIIRVRFNFHLIVMLLLVIE